MKNEHYRSILNSLEESLRVVGNEPFEDADDQRIHDELKKLRETLIRLQRDALDKNIPPTRRDSRSPTGVP